MEYPTMAGIRRYRNFKIEEEQPQEQSAEK